MSNRTLVHRRRLVGALVAVLATALSTVAQATPPARGGYQVTVLAGLGPEPNIAVSPSGQKVMVGGGGASPSTFFLSVDHGKTYVQLHPTFLVSGGADFDLEWLNETTLVAADLSVTGQGVLVHRSTDSGHTWTTTVLDEDVYDRPWIGHAGNTVYVATRGLADHVPYLFVSTDGGQTFGPPEPIVAPEDVDGLSNQPGMVLAHLAVAPDGTLYVLEEDAAGLKVLRRQPGLPAHYVVGPVAAVQPANGFDWLTVDDAGTLYVLSHEVRAGVMGAWLYVSRDRGQTWTAGTNLTAGARSTAWGAIASAGRGRLSLVYLRGEKPDALTAQNWWAEVARVDHADTAHPAVHAARPVAEVLHHGALCSNITCAPADRALYDYISTAVGRDGVRYAVVTSSASRIAGTKQSGGLTGLVFRHPAG